jgi:hypothetical protein
MKNIVIIFDQPVVLPGDEMERITSYGLCLTKSDFTTLQNIRSYIRYFLLVIAQIYKDKTIEFLGKESFKKDGQVFCIGDDVWDEYATMVEKTKFPLAVFDDDNIEISDVDKYDILLTAKERWEDMRGRKGIVWHK